jgi:hypothetical protein
MVRVGPGYAVRTAGVCEAVARGSTRRLAGWFTKIINLVVSVLFVGEGRADDQDTPGAAEDAGDDALAPGDTMSAA